MKSLVSASAAASLSADESITTIFALVLIAAVAVTALYCADSKKKSQTALEVLRILLRTLIVACILLYWQHR